jgi:predicted nucleic acid-binding protein
LKLHLDTSFLIDWERADERIHSLVDEILSGAHQVSIDPIIETEYFAAAATSRRSVALFGALTSLADSLPLTSASARRAAGWLAPMDERMRRAHFADALISAICVEHSRTLVTADRRVKALFPVTILEY